MPPLGGGEGARHRAVRGVLAQHGGDHERVARLGAERLRGVHADLPRIAAAAGQLPQQRALPRERAGHAESGFVGEAEVERGEDRCDPVGLRAVHIRAVLVRLILPGHVVPLHGPGRVPGQAPRVGKHRGLAAVAAPVRERSDRRLGPVVLVQPQHPAPVSVRMRASAW